MKTLNIYTYVSNNGDGSASTEFLESQELADWLDENQSEGFSESSTDCLSFKSESDILPLFEVETKESYLINTYLWRNSIDDLIEDEEEFENFKNYIDRFFPNKLPIFNVVQEDIAKIDYKNNHVFVNGKQVAKIFRNPKESGQAFEDFLNSLNEKLKLVTEGI